MLMKHPYLMQQPATGICRTIHKQKTSKNQTHLSPTLYRREVFKTSKKKHTPKCKNRLIFGFAWAILGLHPVTMGNRR